MRSQVRWKQDIVHGETFIGAYGNVRHDGQDRAGSIAEDEFRGGTHQETLQASPSVSACDHQINSVLVDPCGEGSFNASLGKQRRAVDLVLPRQLRQLLAAVLHDCFEELRRYGLSRDYRIAGMSGIESASDWRANPKAQAKAACVA